MSCSQSCALFLAYVFILLRAECVCSTVAADIGIVNVRHANLYSCGMLGVGQALLTIFSFCGEVRLENGYLSISETKSISPPPSAIVGVKNPVSNVLCAECCRHALLVELGGNSLTLQPEEGKMLMLLWASQSYRVIPLGPASWPCEVNLKSDWLKTQSHC